MVQTYREFVVNQEVAHGVCVRLTTWPLAIMLLAIVLLFARMRADDVIFSLVAFLEDFVLTFHQGHNDVARTGLTVNGFAALLDAVMATVWKSEFLSRLTIVVRMRRAAFVRTLMFLTIHLGWTRMTASESCWTDIALLRRRVSTTVMDERHFVLTGQAGQLLPASSLHRMSAFRENVVHHCPAQEVVVFW